MLKGKPKKKMTHRHLAALRHKTETLGVPDAALQEQQEIEEGLRVIYGDSLEDLQVVDRGASRLTAWLWRTVVGLAVVAFIVFGGIYASSQGLFGSRNFTPLTLSVVAPPEMKSGESIVIEIPYKNPANIPLASLNLDINLPASLKIVSMNPMPTHVDELIYTLGSLGPDSDGVLRIEGVWLAAAPSTTNIQAIATYKPSNFNADFSEIATATVSTKESVITEVITGPEDAVPGMPVTYSVKVKHGGALPMDNVVLKVALPTGFVLSSSVPAVEGGTGNTSFALGTLLPGSETEVKLTGAFASEVSDVQNFSAELQVVLKPTLILSQGTAVWLTDVKGGDIRLTLVGNGLTGGVAVAPGEPLRLSVRLENAGEAPVMDATVLLDFQPVIGIPIDWSKATLDGGALTKDGVRFEEKTVGVLVAGQKKTFNLAFPIKSDLAPTDVDAFYAIARATTGTSTLLSSPMNVNVNAAVAFSAKARYFAPDGATVGSGPLPPKVGETTTYEVVWSMDHALHELDDMVITATLPPGVSFANNATADLGAVSYSESTRTVRFDASGIAAAKGAVTARFFIEATPGPEDEETFMKILSGSALRITDVKTGARIDRSAEPLTTELLGDAGAAEKGTVLP